jgi:hypothetical protein
MRPILFILFFLAATQCVAQKPSAVRINFIPTFGNEQIRFDETYYTLPKADSILFETFKCYISAVSLYNDGKKVWSEQESFHLLNSENEELAFTLNIPADISYNNIHFNLGIDSATSNSGALGGDLDPAKGMFWTWQSGYINCKIEGRSNRCPTRLHEFQYHLGGYAMPDNALQEVSLNVAQANTIIIEIPLEKFITGIDLEKQHSIMSPGPDAVLLAKKLAATFIVR